ncbi:MAG TPA: TetR family transcriptional regulator, partial [Jatrophihabitans sp.]|nr:TetR family transcriptional regulator [Jatrophihabitans sp.]
MSLVTTRMPVAERRAQLVEAALSVAAAEGIGAATVRRVAERAGVALGVVHYCFADKDELLDALAARIVEGLSGAAEVSLDDAPDLAGALTAAIDGMWAAIERAP